MHRLGVRHANVAVISDELIKKVSCEELDPANNDAINEADQSVDFLKLKTLSLSFQKILRLENLETLRNLVKLQLDNNVLQEIDGISHLVHLEWLDLSFNNISSINGLENLVKLTDLSLYDNCISKLENLGTLKRLEVLSIGNNSLSSTEELLYLKCLEKLRVLKMSGNPVCADPEYRPFLLAHLENLQYLDYAFLEENEITQAREQYKNELEELKELKNIEDAALSREADQQKYLSVVNDANMIILETLLTDMFKEDIEINKIKMLPGMRDIIDGYIEKAKAASVNVKLDLLEKHSSLMKEVDRFKTMYEQVQADAQEKSIMALETYRRSAKQLLKQATASSASDGDGSESTVGLQFLQDAEILSEKLHFELMNIESDVVETAQELITEMEISTEAIGSEARNIATEHFRTIETFEDNFFENVSQLAVTLLERMISNNSEYLPDECRIILNDRDALNDTINGSHDIHIGKLFAQEDAFHQHNRIKVAEIVKGAKEQEWARNRARVAEVLCLKEKHLSDINNVRDEINRVDDENF